MKSGPKKKDQVPQMRGSPIMESIVKRTPVSLSLPAAHPAQHEMINAFELFGCRFIVAACGTKFGGLGPCLN